MHEACCNLLDCTNQLQRTAGFGVQERMLYFVKHTTYEYLHGLWPESFTICYHGTLGGYGLVLPLLTDRLSGTG
jgi:hypothetical protein